MKKIGYLIKTQKEKFNSKRSWFVNAWRVVDDNENDRFQPWANTKNEARETCRKLNIVLIEKD